MGWYLLVFCVGYCLGVVAMFAVLLIGEAGKGN